MHTQLHGSAGANLAETYAADATAVVNTEGW